MNEQTFHEVFSRFLGGYWGAFHEVLEAQSVTPRRLAGSLFNALLAEHREFERLYTGPAKSALDKLGRIWHDVETRRLAWPDPPLTHDEATTARQLFEQIFEALLVQGQEFPTASTDVLTHAPHGTPKEPLRADAAS